MAFHPRSLGASLCLLLTAIVGLSACARPNKVSQSSALLEPAEVDDRLRVDDVIEIRVVGESEISGEYRIDPQGQIQFPYAGALQVAGLRVGAVHEMLTKRLQEEYLRNPQVAVHVKEWNSRKVSVLGEVNKPGPVLFHSGMTLLDAIAAAGGFTRNAAMNSVKLRRETNKNVQSQKHRVGDIGEGVFPNVAVLPGDVIVVDERMF